LVNQNVWLAYYAGPIFLALLVLALAALGVALWAAITVGRLNRHYRLLTTDVDGGNLQSVLEDNMQRVRAATANVEALDAALKAMAEANCSHVQHMGFLRFNPFRDTGGDQSFVLALADGFGNGAVISTLHSRDQTRIYAKPLNAWQSAYPLTDEEQQAIRKAREE
jgi:hypothetical protein